MKNRKQIIIAVASILFLLAWIEIVVVQIHNYKDYKYLQIGVWSDFWDLFIWLVLIPLLLFVLILVIGIKGGKRGFTGLIVITFCFFVVAFFHTTFNSLYLVPFISYSDDVNSFGAYDKSVDAQIKARPESGFPQEKVNGVEHIQFLYWYYNSASTHYCVMTSWEIKKDTDFQSEINRLYQCGYPIESGKSFYSISPEHKGFCSEILIDWDNHRFTYFFFDPSDKGFIPKSLSEFYSTDYSKEWVLEELN